MAERSNITGLPRIAANRPGDDDKTPHDVAQRADRVVTMLVNNINATLNDLRTAIQSSVPLDSASHDPVSSTQAASASTSFSDINAANLAVTFTVPDSGQVRIEYNASAGYLSAAGTNVTYLWSVREGTSEVAQARCEVAFVSGSPAEDHATRCHAIALVSGLTPGAEITWKWAHARATGSMQGITRFGGSTGPATISVYAA